MAMLTRAPCINCKRTDYPGTCSNFISLRTDHPVLLSAPATITTRERSKHACTHKKCLGVEFVVVSGLLMMGSLKEFLCWREGKV